MRISGSVEVDLLGEDSGKMLQAADSKTAEGSDTLFDVQSHCPECLQNILQVEFQVAFVVPEIQSITNKNTIGFIIEIVTEMRCKHYMVNITMQSTRNHCIL